MSINKTLTILLAFVVIGTVGIPVIATETYSFNSTATMDAIVDVINETEVFLFQQPNSQTVNIENPDVSKYYALSIENNTENAWIVTDSPVVIPTGTKPVMIFNSTEENVTGFNVWVNTTLSKNLGTNCELYINVAGEARQLDNLGAKATYAEIEDGAKLYLFKKHLTTTGECHGSINMEAF